MQVSHPACLFDCERSIAANYSLVTIATSLTDLLSSAQKKMTKVSLYFTERFALHHLLNLLLLGSLVFPLLSQYFFQRFYNDEF